MLYSKKLSKVLSLVLVLTLALTIVPQLASFAADRFAIVGIANQNGHDKDEALSFTVESSVALTASNSSAKLGGIALTALTVSPSAKGEGFYLITAPVPSGVIMGVNNLEFYHNGILVCNSTLNITDYTNVTNADILRNTDFTDIETSTIDSVGLYGNVPKYAKIENNAFVIEDSSDLEKNNLGLYVNPGNIYAEISSDMLISFKASFAGLGDELRLAAYPYSAGRSDKYGITGPNGEDWDLYIRLIKDDGIFGDGETKAEADKIYSFDVIFNHNVKKYEVFVDGEKLFEGSYSYSKFEAKDGYRDRFVAFSLNCKAPNRVSFDDIVFTKKTLTPEPTKPELVKVEIKQPNTLVLYLKEKLSGVQNNVIVTTTRDNLDVCTCPNSTYYTVNYDVTPPTISLKLDDYKYYGPGTELKITLKKTFKSAATGLEYEADNVIYYTVGDYLGDKLFSFKDFTSANEGVDTSSTRLQDGEYKFKSELKSTGYYSSNVTEVANTLLSYDANNTALGLRITVNDTNPEYFAGNIRPGMGAWTIFGGASTMNKSGQKRIYSFDFKMPDVSEYGMYLTIGSFQGDTMGKYGAPLFEKGIVSGLGSNKPTLYDDTWFNVTCVEDYSSGSTGTCTYYINNHKTIQQTEVPATAAEGKFEYLTIWLLKQNKWTVETGKTHIEVPIYIDNAKAYVIDENVPVINELSYSVDSLETKVADGDYIKYGVDSFKIDMSGQMTTADVKLYVNNTLVDAEVSVNGSTITIVPEADIQKYSDVMLVVGKDSTTLNGNKIGKDYTVNLKAADENMMYYKTAIAENGNSKTAQYIIANGTSSPIVRTLILASYSGGELSEILCRNITIAAGETYEGSKSINDTDSFKAMVWDTAYIPYSIDTIE